MPNPFPKLSIDQNVKSIEEFEYEHFTLHDYDPHCTIKMEWQFEKKIK